MAREEIEIEFIVEIVNVTSLCSRSSVELRSRVAQCYKLTSLLRMQLHIFLLRASFATDFMAVRDSSLHSSLPASNTGTRDL